MYLQLVTFERSLYLQLAMQSGSSMLRSRLERIAFQKVLKHIWLREWL